LLGDPTGRGDADSSKQTGKSHAKKNRDGWGAIPAQTRIWVPKIWGFGSGPQQPKKLDNCTVPLKVIWEESGVIRNGTGNTKKNGPENAGSPEYRKLFSPMSAFMRMARRHKQAPKKKRIFGVNFSSAGADPHDAGRGMGAIGDGGGGGGTISFLGGGKQAREPQPLINR